MLLAWLTDTVTTDLDRALHYTLLWGLESVELRMVGGKEDRVPYVNEEKLTRRLTENELPVVAIVPGLFEGRAGDRLIRLNELARLDETLSFSRRIGCTCIVASSFADYAGDSREQAVDAFRRAGEQAQEYGITLAVLNEADMACSTGRDLARLLADVDHSAVQACWHPAQALRAGEDPEEGLTALEGQIASVRCADGFRRSGQWEEAPIGEGAVGWQQQLKGLSRQRYDGPISLEVNLEPKPKQGLRGAGRLIQLRRQLTAPEGSP